MCPPEDRIRGLRTGIIPSVECERLNLLCTGEMGKSEPENLQLPVMGRTERRGC